MLTDKIYQHWKLNTDSDRILWLSIDRNNTQVNSLNREVITELGEIVEEISKDNSVAAVIIQSAKPSGFIAGADIEQFTRIQDEQEAFDLIRQAQLVFDRLEALRIPTVSMIEGFCLGGGLELVLACRYRVAEEGQKTVLAAPEVKLGIHPGWGGTVRLPRLVGVLAAMDINLSGRTISARAAQKIGLVDAVVPKRQLVRAARYYALTKPGVQQPSAMQKVLSSKFIRPLVAKKLYKTLDQKISREHYPAPYAIVDNWLKDAATGSNAMVNEAKSIARLLTTDTSRNLVRVFFLQTRMKALAKETKFKAQHVHVIGAGTMGGDIAAWCALRGIHVTLQDRAPDYIAPAIKRATELYKKKLKLPRLVQAALDRLMPDTEGLGIEKADVVIEAISEKLEAKQALYKAIEPRLKPGAILATNTSSLPLDDLNKILKNPERLVGIHFFNPVSMMQLVEVVEGEATSPDIVNQAIAFVRSIDRLPLPVKSKPGFVVNRILMPYLMEAMVLLEEGVPGPVIDTAAVKFGMPMGPVELADTVGLDICLSVAEILAGHYGDSIPERLKQMVSKGELGRKTGKGFYTYQKGKPVKTTTGSTSLNAAEITDRLILRMVNESVACLREKVIDDADLLDAGMIFGTGFAPFRGGPLHYAKSRGVGSVYARLVEFQSKFGVRFKPDAGWDSFKNENESASALKKTQGTKQNKGDTGEEVVEKIATD